MGEASLNGIKRLNTYMKYDQIENVLVINCKVLRSIRFVY